MKCSLCGNDRNCAMFIMPVEDPHPVYVCKKCTGEFAASLLVLHHLQDNDGVIILNRCGEHINVQVMREKQN